MNDPTPTATPPAPSIPAPGAAPIVEPNGQNGISLAEATTRFDALGATAEQRLPDTRSADELALDVASPVAKPHEYVIRWNAPGDMTPMSPEAKAFDTSARGWMSSAGLPVNLGNSLVNQITKVLQTTRGLSESQIEQRGYDELDKLKQVHGDKLDERLRQAGLMVEDLEKKQPGLKNFLKSKGIGDDSLIANLLIGHAAIYHARKRR